jgi:hypothetical protein
MLPTRPWPGPALVFYNGQTGPAWPWFFPLVVARGSQSNFVAQSSDYLKPLMTVNCLGLPVRRRDWCQLEWARSEHLIINDNMRRRQ